MPRRRTFRLGWVIALVSLAALACTCGALGQVQQGVQTAQALATQGQALATQAVGLATQLDESGFLETAQAVASQAATSGVLETLEAVGTQLDQPGALATAQALVTQAGGSTASVPDDVPIYPQNASLLTLGNLIAYTANGDLATITDFYKTEMANQGWEPSQDPLSSTAANILFYKKGDRKATVNLSAAGSATTVGIKIEP